METATRMGLVDLILAHAHPIEAAWVVMSLVALTLSIYALRDALTDQAFQVATLATTTDGDLHALLARKATADNNVRQEMARLLKNNIAMIGSLLALVLQPPPPSYTFVPQSMLLLTVLIAYGCINSLESLLDRSTRRQMAKFSKASNPTDPVTGQAQHSDRPPSDQGIQRRATDKPSNDYGH